MSREVDVPLLLERLGIQAKRKGREWWACCPLPGHDERTPSWQIRDDPGGDKHGFWRCLGSCHAGGGPRRLVMQVLDLSEDDAEAWLAGQAVDTKAFLTVELTHRPARQRKFTLPAGVRLGPLESWVEPARAYAARRGITAEQVDRWGLGYAVDGRLSGRIVLPWRDGQGKLVGYTARTFTASPKKYLEPAEDEGADRAAVYGEQHWPPPGQAREKLVLVEGGIDGYAVERATGLPFAALCGSVLLPGHVARLSTWQEVIIASDPDNAGQGLAAAVEAALVRWCRVRAAMLPAGYDCAKLERRRGALALAEALEVEALALLAPAGASAVRGLPALAEAGR